MVPSRVTGAVAPEEGMVPATAGIKRRAFSTMRSPSSRVIFSGGTTKVQLATKSVHPGFPVAISPSSTR